MIPDKYSLAQYGALDFPNQKLVAFGAVAAELVKKHHAVSSLKIDPSLVPQKNNPKPVLNEFKEFEEEYKEPPIHQPILGKFKSSAAPITQDNHPPSPAVSVPKPHYVAPVKAAPQHHPLFERILPYDGTFNNVVFVTHSDPNENGLRGDSRLSLDLGARLASAMNIVPRYVAPYEVDSVEAGNDGHIYVAINCDIPAKYNKVTIAISNDINRQSECGVADFYFKPRFGYGDERQVPNQRVFPINTLPSRATPEIIAAEASKIEALRPDGKPLIAIMLREHGYGQLINLSRIADTLRHKHSARFVFSTGPGTSISNSAIREIFGSTPNDFISFWGATQNPYLSILGAATHFVTSGTLSTTSDLLATGKPVYYTDDGTSDLGTDRRFRAQLFKDLAVQRFTTEILDMPPPDASIRALVADEWKRIGAEFVSAFTAFLKAHAAPNIPGAAPEIACQKAACG